MAAVPPRLLRRPALPGVVRRMLAPYGGSRIVVVVRVEPTGEPSLMRLETTAPVSSFVKDRLREAVMQAGWEPARNEHGARVAGMARVVFEVP